MNCKTIKKLLPEFIEGNLPNDKINKINNHLSSCSDCDHIYQKVKSSLNLLQAKSDISDQAFYYTRLKQKMENKNASNETFRQSIFFKRLVQPIAYLASLVLAVYIGILIGSGSSNPNQLSNVTTSEKDYIQTFAEYQYLDDFELEKIEQVFTVNKDTLSE